MSKPPRRLRILRQGCEFIWLLSWAPFLLFAQAGTSPLIESRLAELKNNPFTLPHPELPHDRAPLPANWLALVSWNLQGGATGSAGSVRPPMVAVALEQIFASTYQLLAGQEVANDEHAANLQNLLPGGKAQWRYSFTDSTDSQDNGLWRRRGILVRNASPILTTGVLNSAGRLVTDTSKAQHPPFAAQVAAGDFDFTFITLHLTFAGGDTEESARELRVLLDFLDEYFKAPGHDPDVILCGDFNIPSRLSGQSGRNGIVLDSIFDQDSRFQIGERRFVVTVHEPTSRTSSATGGLPANNYDHCVISADGLEEFIQARRLAPDLLTSHPADPESTLTSDHFPIAALFLTKGEGIQRDLGYFPAIESVVNGASFQPGVAPGAWVSIFGEDLATVSRIWRNEEIQEGVLPTELENVRVEVNGKPAAVYYVSPSQLNIQLPSDLPDGPAQVEVIHHGSRSNPLTVQIRSLAPAFFQFQQEEKPFAAAVFAQLENGEPVYVGRPEWFGGAVRARPAKPGDTVLLFGTGFGPTSPAVPYGVVFSGAAPLVEPVRIQIGGWEAKVEFAGLAGAGLYQFNVVVPEGLASGDAAVTAQTAGALAAPVLLPITR